MCIPVTVNDMDLTASAMDEAELHAWAQSYVQTIMDEAWRMDCYIVAGTSNGTSIEYQQCAIRALREKFGDGINLLSIPAIKSSGHMAGERLGHYVHGIPVSKKQKHKI